MMAPRSTRLHRQDPAPLRPIVPDYSGACISNLVPALVEHPEAGRGWLPDVALDAHQVVLLVLDGLGAEQLEASAGAAPTLSSMVVSAISSVCPTTTTAALTSIATGTAPGEHGIVGYRIRVEGEVLNALRWTTEAGGARDRFPPGEIQPIRPFSGTSPPVVSPADFAETGFTEAHLRGTTYRRYWMTSSLPVEVEVALAEGHRFVYAYYDGIDKIAHIAGFGPHYDAELAAIDAMVTDLIRRLPQGAALVVTADHGQVSVGDALVPIAPSVLELCGARSGEARFTWLHAAPGRRDALAAAARDAHTDTAWVVTLDQVLDEHWFGHHLAADARARLGDVALVARSPVAYVDPARRTPSLVCRHGSMTSAEAMVPLAVAVG